MTPDRRSILALIGAGLALPVPLGTVRAETARVQREIEEATRRGRPWLVPPGATPVAGLRLPDGAHLIGHPGRSRLLLAGDGPLLSAANVGRVTCEGVAFDGAGRRAGRDAGLIAVRDVGEVVIRDCVLERFGGNGLLLERSGGRVQSCRFADCGRSSLFSLDARGLLVEGCRVERSGENGVSIWRSERGDDGAIVRSNRILDTRADAGGTGPYGNAIAVFRAGGVVVEGNVIRRAAFTAVRNNSGGGAVVIVNNTIADCGEVALYAEFGFQGAIISGNAVDGCWRGIESTNFADHGGRLAAISGNLIRNVRAGRHVGDGSPGGGTGIFAEGDAAITGNVIDACDQAGLQLGWGESLRDVAATGNTIRDCAVGVEVSVAPGAGRASIVGNVISGAKRAAILGMAWREPRTGDLAREGAGAWPRLKIAENMVH